MSNDTNTTPTDTRQTPYELVLGIALSILADDQAEWSQVQFGTDAERGPLGALKHLEKEAREAQAALTDKSEYADCLLLILDAARRAGLNALELVQAAQDKMVINKQRQWSKPTDDNPVEHVREAEAAKPTQQPKTGAEWDAQYDANVLKKADELKDQRWTETVTLEWFDIASQNRPAENIEEVLLAWIEMDADEEAGEASTTVRAGMGDYFEGQFHSYNPGDYHLLMWAKVPKPTEEHLWAILNRISVLNEAHSIQSSNDAKNCQIEW